MVRTVDRDIAGDASTPASNDPTPRSVPPRAHHRVHVFSALRHRNFQLFWYGQIISVTGTWMQSVGQAWLVLQLTNNAFLLGLVSALQFLPVLVFSLYGGVVADKLPKRRILICTQTASALLAFVLYLLSALQVVQVWHILLLAFCLGIVSSLDIPTRQAFISEMVDRDDLMNAISLNSAQFNASRVVGPGVAGLLIALLGIPPLFLLNAISYLAVIAGLALMNPALLHAPVRRAASEPPLRQIREGVVFAWRTPSIRLALLLLFVVSTFGMNFNIILPLLADNVYNTGATGFGFLSSMLGLGSLVSALVLAATVKRPRAWLLVASALGFSLVEFALAAAQRPDYALGLLAILGFASIAFSATANTTLQTDSPDYMRGRVMSLFAMVFAGATPIGALATGELANLYGVQIALAAGAAPCLLVGIYAIFAVRPVRPLRPLWRKRAPHPTSELPVSPASPAVAPGR